MQTNQKPATLRSCGGLVVQSALWCDGPRWLQDQASWPQNPVTTTSPEADAESKVVKEVLAAMTVTVKDTFDQLLDCHNLQKTLRVCTWIARFVSNCCHNALRVDGPITVAEQESQN